MQETKPDYRGAALLGLKKSLRIGGSFILIIIPCMLAIEILQYFDLISVIARWFAPVMAIFNLPGEAGLVFISAQFSNYSGIAAAVSLGLTPHELTVAFVFTGLCHNAVIESAMVKGGNASPMLVLIARFAGAVLCTIIVGHILL